jgi:hypothetical protein
MVLTAVLTEDCPSTLASGGTQSGRGYGTRFCYAVYHGYTACVAKVMVSIPDDLLAEVDSEAARTGTSRSAVLRGFADGALRNRRSRRAETMTDLLDRAGNHGGGAAEAVKATRPS